MTTLLVVERTPGPAWDPHVSVREQPRWDAHAAFMDQLVEQGFVVVGGPIGDEDAGAALLVVEADDGPAAHLRLIEDPWEGTTLLTRQVRPWRLWLRRPGTLDE